MGAVFWLLKNSAAISWVPSENSTLCNMQDSNCPCRPELQALLSAKSAPKYPHYATFFFYDDDDQESPFTVHTPLNYNSLVWLLENRIISFQIPELCWGFFFPLHLSSGLSVTLESNQTIKITKPSLPPLYQVGQEHGKTQPRNGGGFYVSLFSW